MRAPDRPLFLSGPTPRVIAHRGFGPAVEANTPAAFERAVAAGADLLETDVRASLDGVAVLVHDAEVVDSSGRTHRVAAERWEELASLDLAGGARLASLEQVLLQFRTARLNIDVKSADAVVPVADAVRDVRALGRVLITSFSERRRSATIRLLPGAATSASAARFAVALVAAHLGIAWPIRLVLDGIHALQVPESVLGLRVTEPRILRRLRGSGCEIHLWTIDDPTRMAELLALGVDGLVTDRTDLARTAVDTVLTDGRAKRPQRRNTPPT
ncbi:glycerophosphodiester phosphodiesterase family protein [Rathayibacter tanaceti]|uniref:Glycerophosphodiester phosphodiesterase n=2 Tax=Rathayibacter tanaceti TaxID=1671680 RepID=A0A162GUI7_9MICO|nr:glycerophosphodiester phosphodiesterase family protein [Rathayibacter tanaceti]KZX22818.1 Glycerophosphoryl diester phosphodiesterase [Rathayibacter tanaceti]QHC55501.1 glycerophosphodiester phosphodiesterase [Rathayibacter tanaceti]TCO39724.1 glycerophosphoryl diester phosphodiesterase [Rathayibacter tanaceti]